MSSILVYHSISAPARPMPSAIDISPELFARQLRWLARWRQVVPLSETVRGGRGWRRTAITFDDGFRDNLTVALPLLEQYDLPMTLFVSAGYVDQAGYLTEADLRELARHKLVTIGAHGFWHRHFNRLAVKEARTELIESREFLEDVTGQRVDLLAWPFGECNEELEVLAAECGYRAAWSVWKGSNTRFSRWRVPLGRWDNMPRFIAKTCGVYAATTARLHRRHDRRQKPIVEPEIVPVF
jgi:peptidoglycan/xylan/chitin deacetylase (PgdA/CDA1 family)